MADLANKHASKTGKTVVVHLEKLIEEKIESEMHETLTYEVARVYYEKSYSKEDHTPMIKCRFYDEDINLTLIENTRDLPVDFHVQIFLIELIIYF
jgi:hypothetical protein